jgi:Mrp family chromosome partitioning ATPase
LAKSPFESEAMDNLLAHLRSHFDVVILDTAPILAVVDTRVLAQKVDALAMLVRWRSTPTKAVRAALQLVESVGGTVTGIALSMVNLNAQAQSGYGDPSSYYKQVKSYYTR